MKIKAAVARQAGGPLGIESLEIEAPRADEHPGATVADDIRDFGRGQVMVDRGQEETGLRNREVQFDHLDAVRQHRGHAVAGLESERPQSVHDLVARREQFAARPVAPVGRGERQDLGVAFREIPETQLCHSDSSPIFDFRPTVAAGWRVQASGRSPRIHIEKYWLPPP